MTRNCYEDECTTYAAFNVAKVLDPELAAPVVEVTGCMPSVFATLNVIGELITALSSIFG